MYYDPDRSQTFYEQNTVPGQFGPPPTPPSLPSSPSRPFSNPVLLILCIVCLIALLCCIFGNQSPLAVGFGMSFFFGILANVLIVDRERFINLNGRIHWNQARGKKKILLWCLFIFFFPFLLTFYLGQLLFRSLKPSSPQMIPGRTPSRSRRSTFGCLTGVAVTLFCLLVSGLHSSGTSPQTSVASTNQQNKAQIATTKKPQTPPATPTLAPTPTPKPTPTPTPVPPTPTPVPTQPPVEPTQPPANTGVNGNPWGYDFNPGNLIYDPPATFCTYFNCIPSFWESTNGYVMECQDATFSHSGGVQGSCSHHGGNLRPLYSH